MLQVTTYSTITNYKGVDPNPRYGDDSETLSTEGSFSPIRLYLVLTEEIHGSGPDQYLLVQTLFFNPENE